MTNWFTKHIKPYIDMDLNVFIVCLIAGIAGGIVVLIFGR